MPPSGSRLPPFRALRRQSRALNLSASAAQITGPSQASTVAAQGSSGNWRVDLRQGDIVLGCQYRVGHRLVAGPGVGEGGQFHLGRHPIADEGTLLADLVRPEQRVSGGAGERDQRVMLRVMEPDRAHVEPDPAKRRWIVRPGTSSDAAGGLQHDGVAAGVTAHRGCAQSGESGADDDDVSVGHSVSLNTMLRIAVLAKRGPMRTRRRLTAQQVGLPTMAPRGAAIARFHGRRADGLDALRRRSGRPPPEIVVPDLS